MSPIFGTISDRIWRDLSRSFFCLNLTLNEDTKINPSRYLYKQAFSIYKKIFISHINKEDGVILEQ